MKILSIIGITLFLAVVLLFYMSPKEEVPKSVVTLPQAEIPAVPKAEVVAKGLEIPWDIAFLPGGKMLVTERTGHVIEISADGTQTEIPVPGVKKTGEGGLLGMTLHPDFAANNLLYLYMSAPGSAGQTKNRVVRYRYTAGALEQEKVIIDNIPGAIYHDGGRMEFGPDGLFYITTGDATAENIAQDKKSLGGKILRLKDDGSLPADNPFGTAVYSYGHRNPQGLAWDSAGRLWETEHGRSGVRSGLDEINLIKPGVNYGWPVIEGDATRSGMTAPTLHSGATTTWAPASAAIKGNSLFFGGLLGEALYEAVLDGESVKELKAHFKGEYGRIRTVRVGPDGMLYLATSNRDGRGDPTLEDDRIIRINPEAL
jgi:glucose/arabinose dehydrogenase